MRKRNGIVANTYLLLVMELLIIHIHTYNATQHDAPTVPTVAFTITSRL